VEYFQDARKDGKITGVLILINFLWNIILNIWRKKRASWSSESSYC